MSRDFKEQKAVTIIGVLFIATGIIFNEWSLARFLSNDGVIDSVPKRVLIWLVDLSAVLCGLSLLKYKARVAAQWKEIFFSTVSFFLFLLVLEGGLRAFHAVRNMHDRQSIGFADSMGWESDAHRSWTKNIEGYGEIKYSTTRHGFRVFGDVNTNKVKIFVIGDSYTQGTTVSDGETYYDYLKKNHENIEIFAYGAGGFSTLQEYMILDGYFDVIQPDLILWQFCGNDIINNSHTLESLSYSNNSHNTRPYYDHRTGQITLLYPQQDFGFLYRIAQHSYLLKTLNIRLNILKTETAGTLEDYLTEDDPLAQEAIYTTSAIMGMVRKRIGSTTAAAFTVDKQQIPWSRKVYSRISEKYSIHFIHGVPDALEAEEAKGTVISGPNDSHWNSVGHALVGKIILDYLKENKLLEK